MAEPASLDAIVFIAAFACACALGCGKSTTDKTAPETVDASAPSASASLDAGGIALGPLRDPHAKGAVQIKSATVDGLDGDGGLQTSAKRIAAMALPRLRFCYQRALLEDSSINGKLRVSVKFNADGTNTAKVVENAGGLPDSVVMCAARTFDVVSDPEVAGKTLTIEFSLFRVDR